MSLHIVTRREAPQPPYECELITIEPEAVPFMIGALSSRALPFWWQSKDDQKYGRWLMNKEMVRLLMPCGTDIINRQDALYNLLDASLRGTLREVTGAGTDEDPYVYDPEIPQTVDPVVYLLPGMQHSARSTLEGVRNLANGETFTDFPDVRNFRQTLDDILAALAAEDNTETIALLQKIVIALGGTL